MNEDFNELANELNYVGDNDDSVQFHGGAKSFLTEHRSNLRFGFKVVNASIATKVIAIAFGDFPTTASINSYTGETVDALLADGVIVAGVTVTAANAKLKVDHLMRFVKRNPTGVVDITLQANSEEAWKEKITIIKANPFFPAETKYIDLSDFLDQYQQQAKKITIPLHKIFPDFQLDDQAIILLPVGGTDVVAVTGVSLQVTMSFGAVLNSAATLSKKRNKAHKNAPRLAAAANRIG